MIIVYLVLSILLIILLTVKWNVHPFVALLLVALFYGLISGMPLDTLIQSVNSGFGNTLGGIGMIIILGVIIGAFLENTGAAYVIAEKVIQWTGRQRVPFAMSIIGWIVSIPVFADSGFMLLAPLNKSLTKKAGLSLSVTAISLGLGLSAAHALVPPTPGPIAAAHFLQADLGLVMLLSIPVSLLSLGVGLFFANRFVAPHYINPDPDNTLAENVIIVNKPAIWKAILPIVIPIFLIVVRSVWLSIENVTPQEYSSFSGAIRVFFFLGEPFIALLIGAFLCLFLPTRITGDMLSTTGWVGKALIASSSILLITGAGGIFGQVLRDSGIATTLGAQLQNANIGILLPFLLAAAIKTAQGSSTVALITTATIMAPMMTDLGFETEIQKAIVVGAIGSGSLVVSHANDSFFWVLTRMSYMDVKSGYRFHSIGTLVLGTSAAIFYFLIFQLTT